MHSVENTTDKYLLIGMADLKNGLIVSGACGILAPIVAFTGIFLAISNFGAFSWADNALSDLGAIGQQTGVFFNSGLIIGGLQSAVFALGFFLLLKNGLLGKLGAAAFFLDSLALVAIGVFPSGVRFLHYYASVAFFVLFPVAGAAIGISLMKNGKAALAKLTFALAIVAACVWLVHWTIFPFGENVATPEMVAALCAGIWTVALGKEMLGAG
jgi:hypothetical membrane protein